jgi:16S rRNA processing protein RimM
MTDIAYISVGNIAKPHGIHGALVFIPDYQLLENTQPTHFFIEKDGLYSPFFVKEFSAKTDSLVYLWLEQVESREQATSLTGKALYVKATDFDTYFEKEEDELAELVGYTVVADDVAIGKIIAIEERGPQPLFVVENKEKTYLIPAVDEFVIDIDENQEILFLELPHGLLDL